MKQVKKPIPLTEQWLKDFGFKQEHNWFVKYEGKFQFQISISDKGIQVEIHHFGFITVDIEYVHELQNLYFVLTNKELING